MPTRTRTSREVNCEHSSHRSNWNHLPRPDADEESKNWWEYAYDIFLESDPVPTILDHISADVGNSLHNDLWFSCDTDIPYYGRVNDVDTRAILVVISRRERMNCNDWNTLKDREKGVRPRDIDSSVKFMINGVMQLQYGKTDDFDDHWKNK